MGNEQQYDAPTYAVCPTIGIARVGNSPHGFFIGPEAPRMPAVPTGGFKDSQGRVKRQAARFRVYEVDKDGTPVREVDPGTVTWTVELANRKGAWTEFHGRYHVAGDKTPLRNKNISDRSSLEITPGPKSVRGPAQDGAGARFDGGTFQGVEVPLGELRTDEDGRLLVLGGFGTSASVTAENPITQYANNDNWYDDVSDGPVRALVKTGEGQEIIARPAWVIVAPPDFSPFTTPLITLYDQAVAATLPKSPEDPGRQETVSFTEHIYPLLQRVTGYQWVHMPALRGHGTGERGDFLSPQMLTRLASNTAEDAPFRRSVFERLREPDAQDPAQAELYFMPRLAGDDGDPIRNKPLTWLSMLPHQYRHMTAWSEGKFVNDWTGAPPEPVPFEEIPVQEQPHALTRAALEACVGGPFFPGIEMTYIANERKTWKRPFELDVDNLTAGDISKYMALPWQADFYECRDHWWPCQRPDDVIPEAHYRSLVQAAAGTDKPYQYTAYRERWDRGIGVQTVYPPKMQQRTGESDHAFEQRVLERWQIVRDHAGDNDMVGKWSKLGFVVPRTIPNGPRVLVETERAPQVGLTDREWFYVLQHPDRFPEQVEASRAYVDAALKHAEAVQNDPSQPELMRPFVYTREALAGRLDRIYQNLVMQADAYKPAEDPTFRNRDAVVEYVRQNAPFNLLDGVWMRYFPFSGPIDGIRAAIFSVWQDEVGDGNPALNHSALYQELLHSLGIYLPPVDSGEFSQLPLLDSAYTLPAFELAISAHSQDYFPELLGMTMQLEWEVLDIRPTADLLCHYGINPQFFRMHVAIDNASSGHGALGHKAVTLYLDQVRANGGEEAVQEQWKRIWNGYIAFQVTGTLGEDLAQFVLAPPTPEDKMIEIIQQKAPYGSRNHDGKKLGPNSINDWFTDPGGFLDELVSAGLITPGRPDKSKLFEYTKYDGPMYKVFTDEEMNAWQEWIYWLSERPEPTPLTPLESMLNMVDALRDHHTLLPVDGTLAGPDPRDPAKTTVMPVEWWFTQDSRTLLAVLRDPQNRLLVSRDGERNPVLSWLQEAKESLIEDYGPRVPGTGQDWESVLTTWVDTGAPLPDRTPLLARVGRSTPQPTDNPKSPLRLPIHGMGGVH